MRPAYLVISKAVHPDKNPGRVAEATEAQQIVGDAHLTLRCPRRRQAYMLCARISWQYKDEYRDGADACDAAKAVKSKRHHDTGDPRMRKREAEMAAKVDFLLSG